MADLEPTNRFSDDVEWFENVCVGPWPAADESTLDEDIMSETSSGEPISKEQGTGSESDSSCTQTYLIPFDDLQPTVVSPALIEGIMDTKSVILLIGPPGSSKTFVALEIAEAISTGIPWRGRGVRQGDVIYVACEGISRFPDRISAVRSRRDSPVVSGSAWLYKAQLNLLDEISVSQFIAVARDELSASVELVELDTLSQMMIGGDENSASDMTRAVSSLQRIRDELETSVLVLHHTGKDAGRGARGFSGLLGAADTELTIRNASGVFSLIVTKQRDGESGLELKHRLQPIEVDTPDGTRESCIVIPVEFEPTRTSSRKSTQPEQIKLIVKCIQDLSKNGSARVATAAQRRDLGMSAGFEFLVTRTAVRDEYVKRALDRTDKLDTKPDSHQRAFRRLIDTSEFEAQVGVCGEYLCLK